MSGFPGCSWCHGKGCICCPAEEKKAAERAHEPLIVARRNDPGDMADLKELFGADALRHAFGPDGEGMAEVHRNAALFNLKQALRKWNPNKTRRRKD
jgi:hypothetical protein